MLIFKEKKYKGKMSKFFSVPAWSIGGRPKDARSKDSYPGPGRYARERSYENEGVTIPKAGRKEPKRETNDVGPGNYYRGYSSLTKNGISFKGGKFVPGEHKE